MAALRRSLARSSQETCEYSLNKEGMVAVSNKEKENEYCSLCKAGTRSGEV
ncbi:MAG: hypothetical protein K0R19_1094 [Bacillota bacterium]|jgi:hypothetical protein|nr:hypothetical protein [Bacillota bacterium]